MLVVAARVAGAAGVAGADGSTSVQSARVACGQGVDTLVVSWSITNVSAASYEFRVVWTGTENITLSSGTLSPGHSDDGSVLMVAAPHPVVRFLKSGDHFVTWDETDVSPTRPTFCGYQFATATGAVLDFRVNGGFSTETQPLHLDQPVVGFASTPDRLGVWLAAADGGVFALGDAKFFGSMGGLRLTRPVTGMAVTPAGRGYWLVAADGGVFAFGDARYFGSESVGAGASVVGIAATPDGGGYWLARSDGEVLAFGNALPHGMLSATTAPMLIGASLRAPITAIASTPDGGGYWLAAADGGVFAFGDARFSGSAATLPLNGRIVGLLATPDGRGYWLIGSDGGVFSYGDAPFAGSAGHWPPGRIAPVAGMVVAR